MVNTGMKGMIPKEIGNFLRSLTVLIMNNNQITGTIPTSIGKLKQLQGFHISNNSLEGNIPTELCQLENLDELYLGNNKLSGVIPAYSDNLSALRTLSLGSNNFNSIMPSSLWGLSYILHLNLSSNSLTGSLLVEIGNLEVVLDIVSKNQLSGEIPSSIRGLTNLVNLSLSHNELEGSIPDSFGYLVNLKILDLSSRGNFGSVYKATLSDGTIAAVKIFNLLNQNANKSFELFCEILCNIRHRDLVKIITSCSNVDFKALTLEYMPNGNLDMWLYHHDYGLNMLERLNIMIDVALALDYLHNGYGKPIVHCDLKPSNILLDEDMVAHLTDFGISKLLGGGDSITQTITLATVGYMAPDNNSF
ncbi:probable LRR receptor-like serine/threonine-protein kinase At3g47570 [Benincasa hispida]|uniref:probable LRR receptor-like serine/threonine-protein kinase At3g47570 n=1 Tax=Benincasa hispida TaxID=102211 RepID=UPI0019029725|nr:probable LRR receptor-like serine/threonine-protein kinase At3g47570 [Benincasa hispida]